ncbi:hypothetical protein HMPREF0083_02942, partial [Aneurinibacillus aneurinilyticus ATCC 12856]
QAKRGFFRVKLVSFDWSENPRQPRDRPLPHEPSRANENRRISLRNGSSESRVAPFLRWNVPFYMVCRSANLADIDTPFAKNDAMKKGEQMATLWL